MVPFDKHDMECMVWQVYSTRFHGQAATKVSLSSTLLGGQVYIPAMHGYSPALLHGSPFGGQVYIHAMHGCTPALLIGRMVG